LLSCLYLLQVAKNAVFPEIVNLAQNSTFLDFYTQALSPQGLYFVVTQLLGVTTLFILILLSTLVELHYLALMNQRGGGIFNRLWVEIARFTWGFSGKGTLVIFLLFYLISYLLLKGYVADWMGGK
jgi:hypothetical protein